MIKPIERMDHEDIIMSINIQKAGSSIPNADVVYLYRKYIFAGEYICASCGIEIVLHWRKYELYFMKYMEKIGMTPDEYLNKDNEIEEDIKPKKQKAKTLK